MGIQRTGPDVWSLPSVKKVSTSIEQMRCWTYMMDMIGYINWCYVDQSSAKWHKDLLRTVNEEVCSYAFFDWGCPVEGRNDCESLVDN